MSQYTDVPFSLEELKRALLRLKESLALPKDDIVRDSVIQRFEFTVELSWKALARLLRDQGGAPLSPKNVFREAARLNLVRNPEIWIRFIDDRNLSSHTYREELAEKVYATASLLPEQAEELIAVIESELRKI